ncbi:MAG: (2Fe-2S) ferredoxin domain-containing protein [Aggregatilineales bacterium]
MSNDDKPSKRIVQCMGVYCNISGRAEPLHKALKTHVDAINGDANPPEYLLRTANCLSMCAMGPNLVIYPGNVAHNKLTLEAIDAIIAGHLTTDES